MPSAPRLLAALTLSAAGARGHQIYVGRSPNDGAFPGVASIGHVDPLGGGARNPYGVDFGTVGSANWNAALCTLDSDGDGFSNGWELGDPCCEWSVGRTPAVSSDLSLPGDASSVPSARVNCSLVTCTSGGNACAVTPPPDRPSKLSAQAVTGIIIGCVIGAFLLCWVGCVYCRRRPGRIFQKVGAPGGNGGSGGDGESFMMDRPRGVNSAALNAARVSSSSSGAGAGYAPGGGGGRGV
jgi:hypothetical protein